MRETSRDTPVHSVSAFTGLNMEIFRTYLTKGITAVFLGTSGVGKSSLINRMAGEEIFATGEIRPGDDRGRHTTTSRNLIMLPSGGLVIDTPGIREIQLWDTTENSGVFSDIEKLAESCRFRDCKHENEPGCAVREALEKGFIDPKRFGSYKKLSLEAIHIESKTDIKARLEEKRNSKILSRKINNYLKEHRNKWS